MSDAPAGSTVPRIDADLRRRREETILALLEIENAGAVDRLAEVFPHPRYELIGNNRVYDGVDECSKYLRERRNAFPDYHVEPIAHYHADDAVIAEVWISGTHLGGIEAVVPSGKGFRAAWRRSSSSTGRGSRASASTSTTPRSPVSWPSPARPPRDLSTRYSWRVPRAVTGCANGR